MPMNDWLYWLYISTNYFKIIRLGYYFLGYLKLANFILVYYLELVTRKF